MKIPKDIFEISSEEYLIRSCKALECFNDELKSEGEGVDGLIGGSKKQFNENLKLINHVKHLLEYQYGYSKKEVEKLCKID